MLSKLPRKCKINQWHRLATTESNIKILVRNDLGYSIITGSPKQITFPASVGDNFVLTANRKK